MNKTLIGIVIVAVVIVGGYFLLRKPVQVAQTPTSSPSASAMPSASPDTTGWKTYTNAKYGFEFMYPASITPSIHSTADSSNFSVDVTLSPRAAFAISVNPGPHGLCYENCDNEEWQLLDHLGNKFEIHKVFFLDGDKTKVASDQDRNEINQILSTFKFTN